MRRRVDQAGADLAGAGDGPRHTGVDLGQDACGYDSSAVNSGWCATELKYRDLECGMLSPRVISYIVRVVRRANGPSPPTKRTIAGAAAIAKPPMPAVSMIAQSPMSGLASSGP